jgi:hypothetical protein
MPRPIAYAACGSPMPAEQAARLVDIFHQADRAGEGSRGHVAVSVQVLRHAFHHDVDAHRERLLVERAGERCCR